MINFRLCIPLSSAVPEWTAQRSKSFVNGSIHLPKVLSRQLSSSRNRPNHFRHTGDRKMDTSMQAGSTPDSDYEDFFRYTSGRWLWDEERQLRDRYRRFNVRKLQEISANSIGSEKCVSMIKVAEGGYNKIFRLIMDDGKVAIARIPNPNAGPKFYTTASEVATMEFARTVLDIPVPRVYAWSAVDDNSVGSEYIIMEEAAGTPLENGWEALTPRSKLEVMREIAKLEQKMLSLSFSHYGSIYFANSAIKGTVPAEIISDTPVGLKDKVSKTFTIGPCVDRGFWRGERSTMDIDRGPWSNAADYAMSVGRREIAWIKHYAVAKEPSDPLLASTAQNDPEAHVQLLEKYLKVAPYLVEVDQELSESILWHDDLHGSNIFVDGNRITSVIDWQGIWAGPLFLRARPCPVVDYQGPVLLKRPNNFEDLDDERKVQIKAQIARSTLSQLYLLETEKRNPKLARAFTLDHGKTRRLAVEYSGDAWDDDIVSFRETLINVERYWKELGLKENCPIHFTEQDLETHLQEAEGWNEVQDFFDHIDRLVKRDGWTSNERYEDALEFFSELRNIGLQNMTGSEREGFERETRWVDR